MKTKASRRKKTIKSRAEINELENRKTTEPSKRPKAGSVKRSTKLTNSSQTKKKEDTNN